MDQDDLVPLSKAAKRLGLPQRWLRCEAKAGSVPCLRAGQRYFFNLRSLVEALSCRADVMPATRQEHGGSP